MIYLDNAATTYPKPEEVYQMMDNTGRTLGVNAGRGSYKAARDANALINDTKDRLRGLVGADKTRAVVFSPSITIAINQVLNGLCIPSGANVYVSPYEHNAVARCINLLAKSNGFSIFELPIDKEKLTIDLDKTRYEFSKNKPSYVLCTHVSNVTGYILPVKEIFAFSKKYGAINILDSAQSLGLVDIDCKELDVDIIAFAGHKTLYGPLGVGGFINVSGIKLSCFLAGGTGSDSLNLEMPEDMELTYEPSSQNIIAIAGLNAALKVLNISDNRRHEKEVTEYFIGCLNKIKGVKCFAYDIEEQTGIVSFVIEGFNSSDIGYILDEDYDIAVRTGYHCAPYIHKYLGDAKYQGTIRVGIGRFNVKKDINDIIGAIKEIVTG